MPQNRRNYYRVLQVQPDAAEDVIKASYRTLMQKLRFHPDLGGDEANAALVNEAYGVLSDPGRRARYDASRQAARMGLGAAGRRCARTARPERDRPPAEDVATPAFRSLVCPLCEAVNQAPLALPDARRCHACRSPLRPVSPLPRGERGERAVPRLDRRTWLRYRTAEADGLKGAGQLRDVSSHGLRFLVRQPLPVGVMLRLECYLFSAVARVLRCRDQGGEQYVVGAAFVTVEFRSNRGSLVNATA